LPQLGLWLDAHDPQTGPENVFVSHAHSDHTGFHSEVILSEATARLMQARMGGKRVENILSFNERETFKHGAVPFDMTLLPAGHIFGSAMSWIEARGESLLYTGDFKLRPSLSSELCEPRHADILIMETTYGRSHYRFPPTADVMRGVIRFCREALDNDETAVLFGYSLGKSQEVLRGLAEAGLPIVLHGAVHKLTQVYEQLGQVFPAYDLYDPAAARGKVIICPPTMSGSHALRKLGRVRTAVLTGWAVDPNCRFRSQTDAAFPLSDHADFPDLIELVKKVAPKKVYTLHGFSADFAQTLRDLGFDAQALSEEDQMMLSLRVEGAGRSIRSGHRSGAGGTPAPLSEDGSATFFEFAQTCAAVAGTTSKVEKTRLLASYLQTLGEDNVGRVAVWFTGLPFAASEGVVLQLGWALLRDALCAVERITPDEFHHVYLKHSDLGETAAEILEARAPKPGTLTLGKAGSIFQEIAVARGPGAKLPLLIGALEKCSPLEAKYLVKIFTSDLRIGLKEGLVEEAVALAFNVKADEVRQANLLLGNIGETARLAKQNRLASASIIPFRPIKFMLASPEETAADVWERLVGQTSSLPSGVPDADVQGRDARGNRLEACSTMVWIEDKYDGIRCQLHKAGARVALYSRDLKDISRTFPDLADTARHLSADVILDGEIVAMRDDSVLPFAELQKRLGRREADLFLHEEIPIKFVAFDLLWRNGESLLNKPLRERREALTALAPLPANLRLSHISQANSVEEIESAFAAARGRNNEGLMIKEPWSVYAPGRRGLAWLKLKKALATLDCVVVGAEYGHGKRNKVLSDYTFAVRDERTGELKTIGKAYSGLTDAEIAQLTEHFLQRVLRKHGRYHEVQPDTVLEIAFDRINPSRRHNSGLAMRFPRIVRIRTDKSPDQIDTLATARRLVK